MRSIKNISAQMLHGAKAVMQHLLCLLAIALFILTSCSIEPPLRLPAQNVTIDRQAVEIQVELIWENPYWGYEFLYGWEEEDIAAYGPAYYEDPDDYELRMYFLGENPNAEHVHVTSSSMRNNWFRSMFYYGYHDILVWSNIHTPDNTQTVVIDEQLDEVKGTVTRNNSAPILSSELEKHLDPLQSTIYNQPEIYYSAYLQNLEISPDTTKYDYYDAANKCWVKKAAMPGAPLVYIYLLQVVLRNNNDGRITGVNTGGALAGITNLTSVNYGNTSTNNHSLLFDLGKIRRKTVTEGYLEEHHSGFRSECSPGEQVDVMGGRITTYGLCGMPGYLDNKSSTYAGSCPENRNLVAIDFEFKNHTNKVLVFDISDQMKRTCHGGVITIELDASDVPIPDNPNPNTPGGSGFDPHIQDYQDPEVYDFDM